jgi:hypothetical protein
LAKLFYVNKEDIVLENFIPEHINSTDDTQIGALNLRSGQCIVVKHRSLRAPSTAAFRTSVKDALTASTLPEVASANADASTLQADRLKEQARQRDVSMEQVVDSSIPIPMVLMMAPQGMLCSNRAITHNLNTPFSPVGRGRKCYITRRAVARGKFQT